MYRGAYPPHIDNATLLWSTQDQHGINFSQVNKTIYIMSLLQTVTDISIKFSKSFKLIQYRFTS